MSKAREGLKRLVKNFKYGDGQVYVEAYPRSKKNDRSHFDVLRLHFHDIDRVHRWIDMTPDEASDIASLLSGAVGFWLLNDRNYHKVFTVPKNRFVRRNRK